MSSPEDKRPSDERERKKELLRAELKRLEAELVILETQWNKKHHLAAFGLLTFPAAYFWGLPAVMLGLLATPSLVLTQAYLIGVRRHECRQLIDESTRALARLERAG